MEKNLKFNDLQYELSSYLLRYKNNPIQWYAFGPKPLQLAKDTAKPIFLSIGHTGSHWCHLMNEESFSSDHSVAKYLNENFINIKVDKEELPDLDQYMQLASQVMNGKGGWPLNVFLTSEFKPFFMGTYFSNISDGENNPSFLEILKHIKSDFDHHQDKIKETAQKITQALETKPTVEHKVQFEGHYPSAPSILNALKDYQDNEHGGYGVEPKFAHFTFIEWAVEHILEGMVPKEQGDHIIKTIDSLLMGGMYDHVKGGVHRFCIDKAWSVPQFEKVLSDQAALLKVLSKVSLIYPSPLVFDSLIQTLEYLNTEMISEKSYFFSSQDSDSEGVEGLYFTFTKDEFIDALISFDENLSEQMEKLLLWFNIKEAGNFERKLNVIKLNPKYAKDYFTPQNWELIRKVKQALYEARKLRIPPMTDNKGVCAWNFNLLTALIDIIQYCKIETIKKAALETYQKVHKGVHDNFLLEDENKNVMLKCSTTRPQHVPLFEDYVSYMEYNFRSYELFADQNFLENAHQSMNFIFKEFFKDGIFYTRALSFSDSLEYQNIHTPIFDFSQKSALATLIGHLRKWQTHFEDYKDYLQQIDTLLHNLTHLSLQNPLQFGETLRALTYPELAYKKIEVPKKWKNEIQFTQFYINFSFRFALVFHEKETQDWSISNTEEVELKGSGLEEFKKVFLPPKEEKSSK